MYHIILALLMLPALAFAQPLTLDYGVSKLDLNGDGVDDMVVRTRWENMNAHSFDRYLITVTQGGKAYEVPLGESSDYRIQTNEGAECLRKGYVFRLNRQKMLEVAVYQLEAGKQSYCDPTPLTTKTFRLQPNPDVAGLPSFYLKQMSEETSSERYADVRPFIAP